MIEANKIRGHAFGIYGKAWDLASYDSIGVYLQIKLRDFAHTNFHNINFNCSITLVNGVRLRK